MTDDEIIAIRKGVTGADPTKPWADSIKFARAVLADDGCVCRGNWRLILAECAPLFGKVYGDKDHSDWVLVGLMDGGDDYYYVMCRKGQTRLLSCVGSIEGHGFDLVCP